MASPRTVLAVLALVTVGRGGVAHAQDDKAACVKAYEDGQRLKLSGRLLGARDQLTVCARDPCPAAFQPECLHWLEDVNRLMPSIVIEAHGSDGSDLADVRVVLDGALAANRVAGDAIEIDPGEHRLRFEHEGAPPVEQRIVVHEGEKARRVQVTFDTRGPAPAPLEQSARPVPLGVYITGAVALVALGSFAYFGATGVAQHNTLDSCKGHCDPGQVDADRTKLLAADISLGVAAVALAATAVLYLTRPSVRLGAGVTSGGVKTMLSVTF